MFKKLLSVMVIGFALAGCGDSGNTIDFSSPEAVDKSAKIMTESLTNEADKTAFRNALRKVFLQVVMESGSDEAKAIELLKGKLGGKSPEQIIKEYGGNN